MMRRRDLLAGVASAGAVGVGGWAATSGSLGTALSGAGIDPLVLETIDAPGSEAGEVRVPKPGVVTFVDFFGTWCSPCIEQMAALGAAHAEIARDVQFLSVTNEPIGGTLSRADIARWWAEHGGAWTVALDAESGLTKRHEVTRLPTAVVHGPEGAVTWTHTGLVDAPRIVREIRAARSEG